MSTSGNIRRPSLTDDGVRVIHNPNYEPPRPPITGNGKNTISIVIIILVFLLIFIVIYIVNGRWRSSTTKYSHR
jgi:hypothetical protein